MRTPNVALTVRPLIAGIRVVGDRHVVLRIQGTPGQAYAMEGSTNLLGWETLGILTNQSVEIPYTNALELGRPLKSYRVRVVKP
jgi:hypothetical protein